MSEYTLFPCEYNIIPMVAKSIYFFISCLFLYTFIGGLRRAQGTPLKRLLRYVVGTPRRVRKKPTATWRFFPGLPTAICI